MSYFGFIYEWTNLLNGKKYIGSHEGTIEDGYIGSGKVFQKAIKKYGIKNFTRSILEYVEVKDRKHLLEREKHYLDNANAYYSSDYYNVAKDVIGGNTKAGWTETRRKEFSDRIKQIWANRTEEEKKEILNVIQQKNKEWIESDEGKEFRQRQRENFNTKLPKIIEGIRNRDPVDRRRSAKLGKDRMGKEKRKLAAQKGVLNRDPDKEKEARKKASQTKNGYSAEKKKEVFENMSRGRKDKCVGKENGRAISVVINGKKFDTKKEAMLQLNLSEYKLNKLLKES